jgi:multimeric flavodoxin WrbA
MTVRTLIGCGCVRRDRRRTVLFVLGGKEARMESGVTRRKFLGAAGTAVAAGAAVGAAAGEAAGGARSGTVRIVGICCSPRKGKTTMAALGACLESAKAVDPSIEVEAIELAGLRIDGSLAAGIPLEPGVRDDFPAVAAKLADPAVAGVVIATPVYFGNMTSLCKAFLDRCMLFRKDNFALSDKVGGVLAVGGVRSGGQELTIGSVQNALFCQEMVVVGDGRPTAHTGATVWNPGTDDISKDEFGLSTARNLGRRVAQVALKMARSR